MWVLGIKPGLLEEHPALLTTELSLLLFKTGCYIYSSGWTQNCFVAEGRPLNYSFLPLIPSAECRRLNALHVFLSLYVLWNPTGFKTVALRTVCRKIQGDYKELLLQSSCFAFWLSVWSWPLLWRQLSQGSLCLSRTTVFRTIQLNPWWVRLLQNLLLATWINLLTGKLIAYLR